MRQNLFVQLLANDNAVTIPTAKKLLKAFILVLQNRILIGDKIGLPRFGVWYAAVRQGKNIYNPYYHTLTHYSARNIIKFKTDTWSGQEQAPAWRPYYDVTGTRYYPQCRIAELMRDIYEMDILICNQFCYKLVDRLNMILEADDKISFNNLGTFKIYHNEARNGRNPRNGATIAIPARRKIIFIAAKYMKENI